MGTLLAIPGVLVAIGILTGGAIIGFLNLVGVLGKAKSDDIKTAKNAADFVISSLEGKIKILEDKIAENQSGLEAMGKRLEQVVAENQTFREVLQGRDAQAQEFQKKGLDALNTAVPEILEMTKATNNNVNKLAKSIDTLVKAMNIQTVTTTTTVPVAA
jgi:phage shock protein A